MSDTLQQDTMWEQYIAALEKTTKLSSGEALHVVYPYQNWDWGGRDPIDGSYPYEQWAALNVVPNTPGQDANAQSSASQFDVAYRDWFDLLTVGDLGEDKHYQQLQDEISNAANRWTELRVKAEAAYSQSESGDQSFDDWLDDTDNFVTKDEMDTAKDDYKAKKNELADYQSRIQSPVTEISADFTNSDYQAEVVDPATLKAIAVKPWKTVPGSPWQYLMEITNSTFSNDAVAGTSGTLSFDSSSNTYDYSAIFGSKAGLLVPFPFISASSSSERIDVSRLGKDYSIDIEWQDLQRVSVLPDAWFSGSAITTYGRGDNYATGYSAFKNGNNNYFFGPGGALSRLYTGIIVAYRPKVTIKASDDFTNHLYEKWKTGVGFSIGVISFGGSETHEKVEDYASAKDGSFTIQSNSNWPVILGYVSAWTLAPE